MNVPFIKYHGLGNDFLLIPWASPDPFPPEVTRRLCDRHFGVGADGVLLVVPSPGYDAQMVVLNADGSRPEMCGNGIRCVAFHMASSVYAPAASVPVRILTDAGPRTCLVELPADAETASVSVDMGSFSEPEALSLDVNGQTVSLLVLSVGNPHAVSFAHVDDATFSDLAPRIAVHPRFKGGINASFASLMDDGRIQLRVWERGVGPTLACGTAACATSAAATAAGLVPSNRPINVRLPGGDLEVRIDPSTRRVEMTGPATRVFQGSVRLSS